jgi:rubrerythrin
LPGVRNLNDITQARKECNAEMNVSHHNLTVSQLLDRSLDRERQSHDFYEQLAADCSVGCIKELLDRLKGEESKHIGMIQKMIARLEMGRDVLA